jgi:hypothetical protein
MYLVPAWMFDSVTWMLPTPSDEPVVGMICMMPMAPT